MEIWPGVLIAFTGFLIQESSLGYLIDGVTEDETVHDSKNLLRGFKRNKIALEKRKKQGLEFLKLDQQFQRYLDKLSYAID